MDNYWQTTSAIPSSLHLHNEFIDLLNSNMFVIDLGCGEGISLSTYRKHVKNVIGIDLNLSGLQKARLTFPSVNFVYADLSMLPFKNNLFDAGILQAVLTVIEKPASRNDIIRESHRIIDRGFLYISEFLQTWQNPYYKKRYEQGLKETGEKGSFLVREHDTILYQAHHFTEDELTRLLEKNKFCITKIINRTVLTRSGNMVNGIVIIAKK